MTEYFFKNYFSHAEEWILKDEFDPILLEFLHKHPGNFSKFLEAFIQQDATQITSALLVHARKIPELDNRHSFRQFTL
jgi:hypothetical protein